MADNSIGNLYWGSFARNNGADKLRDGTALLGCRNHAAKLTELEVTEIRRLYAEGVFQKVIAGQFGVSQQIVSVIVRREVWPHVA